MFTASEYGFRTAGLDLRQESVDAIKAVGFEAHCLGITDFVSPAVFDVISMADCLEHVPFPKKALLAAHQLLEKGGVLFLSMPNMGAPLWGYLNQANANPYWGEIEHYHNFSRVRLHELLHETGFKPISYGVSPRYRCCMEVLAHPTDD